MSGADCRHQGKYCSLDKRPLLDYLFWTGNEDTSLGVDGPSETEAELNDYWEYAKAIFCLWSFQPMIGANWLDNTLDQYPNEWCRLHMIIIELWG